MHGVEAIKTKKRLTAEWLRKIGVPSVLITGLVFGSIYGFDKLRTLGPDYHKNTRVFAYTGMVREVKDGDTIRLQNGFDYRLIGINAPDRGEVKYEDAKRELVELVENKRVYLEYDRYQDDKYGPIMVWVWINCEGNPKFTKPGYMRLSFNRSREGLKDNPEGCKKGKLGQEEMIKAGLAKVEVYKDRGELKYEERLRGI